MFKDKELNKFMTVCCPNAAKETGKLKQLKCLLITQQWP